mgnify:FL=1
MDAVRDVVNEGLSLRAKAQIKVRQPLESISVTGMVNLGENTDLYLEVLREELNVKQVNWDTTGEQSVELNTELSDSLVMEGLAREIVRFVQNARKDAGLEVDDRINLSITTDSEEVRQAIKVWTNYITSETLTTSLNSKNHDYTYSTDINLNDNVIHIKLQKS